MWSHAVLALVNQNYGSSVLAVIPANLLHQLQLVMNVASRLIFYLKCSDHIADILATFYWLWVPKHIQYKIAILTYKVLRGCALFYLGSVAHVNNLLGRQALMSANTNHLVVPPSDCHWSVAGCFRLLAVASRTGYLTTLFLHCYCQSSGIILKLTCSRNQSWYYWHIYWFLQWCLLTAMSRTELRWLS